MKKFDPGKYISRKFLIFAVATILLVANRLSEGTWLVVAALYIGVEGALDFIRGVRK